MDPTEIKSTCAKILTWYKSDPEEAHIWEDVFIHRFLRNLVEQVQILSCDAPEVKELQQKVGECMEHIEELLHTERKKWFS